MIDFHSHILPGMDDGSRSVEESLEMLKASAEQGVDILCSTSHFYAHRESPESFIKRRGHAIEKLQPFLTDDMPEILYGAEIQYFEGICNADGLNDLKLQGTDILLIEMPFSKWTDRMLDDVYCLGRDPHTIVMLAHIERYLSWNRTSVLADLHENGVVIQSNASFFLTWKTRRKAMSLLRRGLINVLGSDCHNSTSRTQEIGPAREMIENKCGADTLNWIDRFGHMLIGKEEL